MFLFLKENWFKVSIIIILTIIAFLIFNNNRIYQKNTGGSIVLAKQCREDGEKLLQEEVEIANSKENESNIINCYYMDPEFIFNPNLQTCLYSGGYTCELNGFYKDGPFQGHHITSWQRRIVDIYTNKELKSVYVEDSSNIEDWKHKLIEDFWSKSTELGF